MNKKEQSRLTGFMRLKEVLNLIPVGKTSWYDGVRAGIYPSSVKIGKRTSAWRSQDIHDLIAKLGDQQ